MGGSQKSRRVNWASDVNLCQVRLFLSEESPSQVGMGTQDHLQAKTVQSSVTGSDDNLPPGFEGVQPENPWTVKLSQIPFAKWKCPLRFVVNIDWRVVSGEESGESELENQREMRVLEAIYPRPSAIPPNPSELVSVEDSTNNDQFAPLVPITPIEDEDAATDVLLVSSMADNSSHTTPQMKHLSQETFSSQTSTASVGPDILSVARAALTSVMSKNDQGNLIDGELLIKLLSDPKMIEQLVTNHAASSTARSVVTSSTPSSSFHSTAPVMLSTTHHIPSSMLQGTAVVGTQTAASSSAPSVLNMPSNSLQFGPSCRSGPDPVSIGINRREPVAPPRIMSSGPFYPPTHGGDIPNLQPDASTTAPPSVGASTTKDVKYYKNLIQQHGGERRDVMLQYAHQNNQPMSRESQHPVKPKKIMKPCIYFHSARGCRKGANCAYLHDGPSQQQRAGNITEVQTTKRVKLDREITGT